MSDQQAILIPGAFALPGHYDAVVNAVAAQGHSIRALHLPSVGYKSGVTVPPCMEDDAAFIASEVADLADQGRDEVLIAHSYGDIPATQRTKGLGKAERQAQGMKGGIVHLAFMNCLVLLLRASDASILLDPNAPPKEQVVELKADVCLPFLLSPTYFTIPIHMETRTTVGYITRTSRYLPPLVFRICREKKVKCGQGNSRATVSAFPSELGHAGYKDIPVSWLLGEEELCIPATLQKESMAMVEREKDRKVDVTSFKAGHCPFISKPNLVTDWVLDVVAKVHSK
ncbi:hypothetical protein ASPCADRAFT_506787 [Aspergillus carbonarius ITEM 5010]|uniref:AB hydrolase-1 domain-containing protein n=1 Tax=Aspergillus carbonarius (strain ITEM 5010) TaxID=602072 RepID=A0A1R3RND1_ASPC5|nr:hypothetical protein ASPCADRAFT_506787 [Aspergillus carbonarius ITEM 5010]